MSHGRDCIKPRWPGQMNPLLCINIKIEAWLLKKKSLAQEDLSKNKVFMDQKHALRMHQLFQLTASPVSGYEGGVSLRTSCQSITEATRRDKQPPTRVGIQSICNSNRIARDFISCAKLACVKIVFLLCCWAANSRWRTASVFLLGRQPNESSPQFTQPAQVWSTKFAFAWEGKGQSRVFLN